MTAPVRVPPPRRLHRDALFWAAVAAAVAVWLALAWWIPPRWPPALPGSLWNGILLLALYPFVEELVFRAGLQAWLREYPFWRRRWLGISAANAMASGAFALAHLIGHPPLWALSTAAPSLVFGFFWDRYARLAVCVGLHAFYNLGYFLFWD